MVAATLGVAAVAVALGVTAQPALAVGTPVGWATQNGGTTGGGNASPTTVTSSSALISAMQASGPAVIQVSGMISISGMQEVASDKTILGVGSNSGITGGGLNVDGASNVIIQNLNFSGWGDDAVNVQESATNIWVDHNTFSDGFDGAVDIKRGSDFATVSWNRFFNHDKTMLLGHSDDNGAQDRGHLRVTYHHNWFDGTNSRHPRVRFGNPVHVFNNYYNNIGDYGVASTIEGGVRVERNYFENVDDPYHAGEGDSPPGSLVAVDNFFVNSGSGQTAGSVAGIPYGYTADPAANVKSIVTAGAGAGRLTSVPTPPTSTPPTSTPPTTTPGGCAASYAIGNAWPGGFQASVTVRNSGTAAINGWRVTWTFANGQAISSLWNGTYTPSGANAAVTNASYNGNLAAGASTSFGFTASQSGTNAVPGVTCTAN